MISGGTFKNTCLFIFSGTCEVAAITKDIISDCNGDYSWNNEDHNRYYPGWSSYKREENYNKSEEIAPWSYRTSKELRTYPYIALIKSYSGGGYAMEINTTSNETIRYLQSQNWIDRYTRAVFIEMSLYNVPTNLFVSVSLVTEFLSTNSIVQVHDIKVAQLHRPQDLVNLSVLACELVTMVFLVCFIYRECKKTYKLRKKYFNNPWNWLEITIITLVIVSCVILILREVEKSISFDCAKPTNVEDSKLSFINISPAAALEELYICCLGFLVFFSNLKLLKLTRFSHRIVVLSKTLSLAAPSLLSFFVVFLCTYLGYASVYYLTIGPLSKDYHSFITTLETLFSTLLGGFDFDVMVRQVTFIGPFFFCTFMIFVVMILMNIFLAIIMDSITEARNDETLENEDVQLLKFALSKISKKLGIQFDLPHSKNNESYADDDQITSQLESTKRKSFVPLHAEKQVSKAHVPDIHIDSFENIFPEDNKIETTPSSSSSFSLSSSFNENRHFRIAPVSVDMTSSKNNNIKDPQIPLSRSRVNLDIGFDIVSSSSESLSLPNSPYSLRKLPKLEKEINNKLCSADENLRKLDYLEERSSRVSLSTPSTPTLGSQTNGSDLRRQALSKSFKETLKNVKNTDEVQSSKSSDKSVFDSEKGISMLLPNPPVVCINNKEWIGPLSTPQIGSITIDKAKTAPNSPYSRRRDCSERNFVQSLNTSLASLSHPRSSSSPVYGSSSNISKSSLNLSSAVKDENSKTNHNSISNINLKSMSKSLVDLQSKSYDNNLGLSTFERSLRTHSPQVSPYLQRKTLDVNFGSTYSINAIGRYSVPNSPVQARRELQEAPSSSNTPEVNIQLTSLGSSYELENDDMFKDCIDIHSEGQNIDASIKTYSGKKPTKDVKASNTDSPIWKKLETMVKLCVIVFLDELVLDTIVEELLRKGTRNYIKNDNNNNKENKNKDKGKTRQRSKQPIN